MSEPLATVPEEIIDACEAVRAGEYDADEQELIETFHVAEGNAKDHVLATLGVVRRQRGAQ